MRDSQPSPIFLKEYRAPEFFIDTVNLEFLLYEDYVQVNSKLNIRRNPFEIEAENIFLNGEELDLLYIALDGKTVLEAGYEKDEKGLTVFNVPDKFELECQTRIKPHLNTRLEGLYKSKTMFCTQCEAEGFRRITFFSDRPDVMSRYEVTIEAEEDRYPVLLSNGNLHSECVEAGRRRVTWIDPYPKPSYLFALVAGDLAYIEDQFVTARNRRVVLRMYVEPKDLDKCAHAIKSLKEAMRWDQESFGREYDLDVFNIVAVDDFNMGAMENKGLNIFNTSCVLASPETTTDVGFQRVESIVAHEYFHNWSGNRVTCRDWFQLSLKEGFTVYRDAEFSSDMGSRVVKRIEDATVMRTAQFAEDAGPMAHPVRPASYIEISNFYTLTVYEKGAEVVRMLRTLLGGENFRQGSDLYFDRHDGEAVTCEEFIAAMEDASKTDLSQFRLWYSQAGTPVLSVNDSYDKNSRRYTLKITQDCPSTPGQTEKKPLVIPLAMGLLGQNGNLPLFSSSDPFEKLDDVTHKVLIIDQPYQEFVFEGLSEKPIPSLLRGFSAPVRLNYSYSRADLCALISRDEDGFVRWDACQQLAVHIINDIRDSLVANSEPVIDPLICEAWRNLLNEDSGDSAMVAAMVRLPSEMYLGELASQEGGIDVDLIHRSRELLRHHLGKELKKEWLTTYERSQVLQPYSPIGPQIALRSLANISLDFLSSQGKIGIDLAQDQLKNADNMTNRLTALRLLAFHADPILRDHVLGSFYQDWKEEVLIVNQWLQVQASMPDDACLDRIKHLVRHEAFDLCNPNKVRSLIGCYAQNNPTQFHRIDGAGYKFLIEKVTQLNSINPQVAARLLAPLTKWRNFVGREILIKIQLEELSHLNDLSKDVFEVVKKSLE